MSVYLVTNNTLAKVEKNQEEIINSQFMSFLDRIFDQRGHNADPKKMIEQLALSPSLNKHEKMDVLERLVRDLSSFQINSLLKVFSEEKAVFAALDWKGFCKSSRDMNTLHESTKRDWAEIQEYVNAYYHPKLISKV